MFSTLNNWLCKEIIYNCCFGDYDVAVNLFYDNLELFTDDLYCVTFSFAWYCCGLRDYLDVLRRLRNRSFNEQKMFSILKDLKLKYQHIIKIGGVNNE